ncbi:ABC transporter permease [Synergistes jonesii]|uniref:ABC transporter permease n=1 Tax=Synergistes jonesii TaxID=2754 RepID=UPI0006922F7F|nr:ABC transporter permease [Synergistes jonesii]
MTRTKTIQRVVNLYNKRELLTQLVRRDIRLKYRRSVLGYLWSVMNPLLIMIVLTGVFSNMFRYDIINYPIYLLIGRAIFDFLSESTRTGMWSIIGNAALLKKTYVPRYIFTLASVTSSAVNFIFSLGAIAIVMLFTKTLPSWYILLLPITLLQLYVFCMGMAFFLAAATVYFRDVQYIYNAFLTAWMYLSALFYPAKILPQKLYWLVSHFNPIFIYVQQARGFILYGKMPDTDMFIIGCFAALLSLVIGVETFRRTQDNFILYI